MPGEYSELTEMEKRNLVGFLERSQTAHLDKMKKRYKVGSARSLDLSRQNVLDCVMMGAIPLGEYIDWLSHVELEGNNSLFIYEPKVYETFEYGIDQVVERVKGRVYPLYSINAENLNEIRLVNVQKGDTQIIFTFSAPATVQEKDQETGTFLLKKHVYLAYVIMDFELKHYVLSMHPTVSLTSIAGETKKKEWDELTWVLINEFRQVVGHFEFADPTWLTDSLYKITEEFFYHNNPTIEAKLTSFRTEHLKDLTERIIESERSFSRADYRLRVEKSLLKLYESELMNSYKHISKSTPFEVFLQQSDKGITEFKANSRGKALSYSEAGEIIKLMWENGDIVSLGIIHYTEGEIKRKHPYIISKSNYYYALKKYTTSQTEKEAMNDVLRKLNKYKQEVRPSLGRTEETGL
ncbi:hypothetical protein FHS18_004028 [Paenibacillus phyllosphaerae]|uniref:Uncharacterized protein n=1 Tax=Paenibacillus phyllosphaerae TaxID=274593 RepID=A0A7W5B022_9BACL|nr:hypothetical protein [Paenibacillus phyllosphaerae]MBB3111960.1 hypothetical protein [Paenibacillus phyllosphaerae]